MSMFLSSDSRSLWGRGSPGILERCFTHTDHGMCKITLQVYVLLLSYILIIIDVVLGKQPFNTVYAVWDSLEEAEEATAFKQQGQQ